jgi:Predicted integral membrane protein
MNTENITLMRAARESLKGKWGLAIVTFLIFTLLTTATGSVRPHGSILTLSTTLTLIIGGPLALGAAIFSLSISRGKEARLEQIFQGFNSFSTAFVAYILIILYVLLWALLLIVPGIIAALGYYMTFYILADDPLIKPQDALKKSKSMMDGYKLKLFYLGLRFFLLALLCILTLGIGFLWLIPYVHVTMAKFYDDIKGN